MLQLTSLLLVAVALPVVVVLLVGVVPSTLALDNGLALTPPMGWLPWERFTCTIDCERYPNDCINERLFKQMADRMVSDGYVDAGYQYVNIDDCWNELYRDSETERLIANGSRFPVGIEALAHYMHDRGLKLGIYGDCGLKTCGGYPGQLKATKRYLNDEPGKAEEGNYFAVDANTFSQWQIDSLKFDGCYIDPLEAETICPGMALALNSTQRSILLVCEWPFYMMYAHAKPDFSLAAKSCNVWRYYDDIEDSWLSILNTIDYTVKHQSTIVKYHGPGHWFDPDQLVIGNFGLSWEQARAQMALWCIWSSPLYMSNDLRSIDSRAKDILQNKELIAINQDKLAVLGVMVKEDPSKLLQVFVKPILPITNELCPSFALVYLNRNIMGGRVKVSFKLSDLLPGAPIYQAARHAAEWARREPDSETIKAIQFNPSRCLNWLMSSSGSSDGGSISGDIGAGNREDFDDYESSDDNWRADYDHNSTSSISSRGSAKFKVFDLFDGVQLSAGVGIDEELTLPVAPSGVRAVRLQAI